MVVAEYSGGRQCHCSAGDERLMPITQMRPDVSGGLVGQPEPDAAVDLGLVSWVRVAEYVEDASERGNDAVDLAGCHAGSVVGGSPELCLGGCRVTFTSAVQWAMRLGRCQPQGRRGSGTAVGHSRR